MKKTILIVLVISLSLFCLLISLEKYSMDIKQYRSNYKVNNVQEITGRSMDELVHITEGLIQYLKGKVGNEALRPHYNEKEILHMEDVQVLFKYGFILKYITIILSLVIIIFFTIKGEKLLLAKYTLKGMFINWILLALLLIMIFFDFNKYFTYFHLIFFTNDLWLLDPRTDLLIQMLPEKFFIDIAIKIGLSFLVYVAIIQVIAYAIVKKGRIINEEEKNFQK